MKTAGICTKIRGASSKITLAAMAICAAGLARAATWQGGASGTLDDAASWDGDITTSAMVFTNDVTLMLSADATVYNVLTNYSSSTIPVAARSGRTVVFDMGGNTLRSWGKPRTDNTTMWHLGNSTYRFTNGTFLNVAESGSVTNVFLFENANMGIGTIEATGSGTTFVSGWRNRAITGAPGAKLHVLDHADAYGPSFYFAGVNSTNEVSGGATLHLAGDISNGAALGIGRNGGDESTGHGNVLLVSGGKVLPTAEGSGLIAVGYRGNHSNALVVENGGQVLIPQNLHLGASSGATGKTSSNNLVRVTGTGSVLTQPNVNNSYVNIGQSTGDSNDNEIIVEDGGVFEFARTVFVGADGTNNAIRVKSGGAMTNTTTAATINIGRYKVGNADSSSANSLLEVAGSGSRVATHYLIIETVESRVETPAKVRVADGASLSAVGSLRFYTKGGILEIDNATASVGGFFPNGHKDIRSGTNATIRISGESARLNISYIRAVDNSTKKLCGAAALEFAIPENGWASAPFATGEAFTIGADTTLTLDADSVKAYVKANPNGGTVPLIATGNSSRAITIEDATALAANLPDGCSLVNASGVLSVKMPKAGGLTIIVR